MAGVVGETGTDLLERMLADRDAVSDAFFPREVERIVQLCRTMAERFAAGGRLLALGGTPQDASDAHHVAVEFVHPVIVGKRALPAVAVTRAGGGLEAQVDVLARAGDMVIAFAEPGDADAVAAVSLARERGCLTIACVPLGAEWQLDVPTDDADVRQELVELLYHVLWEHVHVFLDQEPVANGSTASAANFLYPFLQEEDVSRPGATGLTADVTRSVLAKVEEASQLRRQTLTDNQRSLLRAAVAMLGAFEAGGTLFAFGNGGSATDAMDLVADLCHPQDDRGVRPAVDLSADGAIVTALANDIGPHSLFSRQLIALATEGDVALAFSTSGDSPNVVEALAQARRHGMLTLALVGYGGGKIAAEELADHVIVTGSEYVPRIQEAQATACHGLLRMAHT